MNALHVVIVSNAITHEGDLAECSSWAKEHGGTIKTARAWAEQQARQTARKNGEQATQTVAVLLQQGVVPAEQIQAAIETLKDSRYKNSGILKLALANKPLSAAQISRLIGWAGEVAGEKKALRKLSRLVTS